MSRQRFAPEFKEEAVRQVVERGYGVPDVASPLGVSAHSLYKWLKAVSPDRSNRLQREFTVDEPNKVWVTDIIEIFYNRTRRRSHIGGVSPEAFETAAA